MAKTAEMSDEERRDERRALQVLLRGATESDAEMPATSPYARSVAVLRNGLLDLLREVPESRAAARRF